jgi:hypothetical protein
MGSGALNAYIFVMRIAAGLRCYDGAKSMASGSEIVVPLPELPERATAVRGTVLLASQDALRGAGHFDLYASRVEQDHRASLLAELVPNTWVDIERAMAHYRACESLGLPPAQVQALGGSTGDRINSVFVKSLIRLATGAIEPWFAWKLSPRVWSRAWKGSAIGVRRLGPQEARVDVVGFPCAAIPYVRTSLAGFFTKNTELFCHRAVVRPVRPSSDPMETASYVVSWS